MYTIIAVLAPSILGVKIIDYLNKGLTLKNTIYYYVILLLLSTMFNNLLCYTIWDLTDNVINYLNNLPIFFCKYTLISTVVNVLLALAFVVIIKNISFNLEVEKNEKQIKQNKKKYFKNSKKNISK